MKTGIKVPDINDVADLVGAEHVSVDGYNPSLIHQGVSITQKNEGRGHRYSSKVVFVVEPESYSKVRRKVYVHSGTSFKPGEDTLGHRPFTDAEKVKILDKFKEMKAEAKDIKSARRARDRAYEKKRNDREALRTALEKAKIDEYGHDELPISIYTDNPKISIDIGGKKPAQVVAIYKAVEKALKETM